MRFDSTCPEGRLERAGPLLAAAALSTLLASVPAASGPEQETPAATACAAQSTFRSATELVALQVSVVDAAGKYVSGLAEEDFGVYDDGVRQTIALFASANAPIDVMLLLDTSTSMTDRLGLAQKAAIGFLRALRSEDRAAVVFFDTRVRVAHALTSDLASLETALRDARPAGGTALYQAVYIALRELAVARRRDDRVRRQALVVLTDGDDNASSLSFEHALDEARQAAVTIFAIVPAAPPKPASLSRYAQQLMPYDLRVLTEETGGRSFMLDQRSDLAGAYRDIAEELGRQYWLGYVPPRAAASGFKRVSVRIVSRPGLQARTRSGYYASETPRRRPASGHGQLR